MKKSLIVFLLLFINKEMLAEYEISCSSNITHAPSVEPFGALIMKDTVNKNPCLELLHATSQEWIAGVRGGGRGINYKLRIKIKTDKKVEFDSIWVAGKKLNIKLEEEGQYAELKLSKNYVVTLLASDYMNTPGKTGIKEEEKVSSSPVSSASASIEYKGAALLRYMVDGSVKYFEVPDITILPAIYGQ